MMVVNQFVIGRINHHQCSRIHILRLLKFQKTRFLTDILTNVKKSLALKFCHRSLKMSSQLRFGFARNFLNHLLAIICSYCNGQPTFHGTECDDVSFTHSRRSDWVIVLRTFFFTFCKIRKRFLECCSSCWWQCTRFVYRQHRKWHVSQCSIDSSKKQ